MEGQADSTDLDIQDRIRLRSRQLPPDLDREAFTQGLLYYDGFLYEATGIAGKSSLRKVELATGKVLQRVDLLSSYFGEGLVLWKDKLIQLTWTSKIGFVYDRASFRQI